MQVHRTVIDEVLLFVPPHDTDLPDATATFDVSVARRHGVDTARLGRDSQSRSARGVVRGLHGRLGPGGATLVRCAHGAMHAIVVDARPSSPTFGRVASFLLDDTDLRQLFVPAGCLHGFQALTDSVDTCYRIDTEHDPAEDVAVRFDDPDLAVRWPLPIGTVSPRDRSAGSWADLCDLLGVPTPEPVRAVLW